MLSLTIVGFIGRSIGSRILKNVLNQLPHIEQLFLTGNFSNINLDYLFNLKSLSLIGTITKTFNSKFFRYLCDRLVVLKIESEANITDEKRFFRMFNGRTFTNLQAMTLKNTNLKRLSKRFINRFPNLRKLFIIKCNLEVIEQDAFSKTNKLDCLDLSENRLKSIEKDTFSYLKNLQILDLSRNDLTNLDAEFIGVMDSVKICLENN